MIGKNLSQYEITEKLGQGGMGEVYLARDTVLGRSVAIKVLPPELADDPERIARFEREARSLAALHHPNIASIFGFEEAEGIRFLVMELVIGSELTERMDKGPVPIDDALLIARQMAEGIEAAHEQGIVHRDLKPANVKITPVGQVKILDFGLARAVQDDPSEPESAIMENSPTLTAQMTHAGMILGTAGYMSPEQARGQPVDQRADIWAFGSILFEMLSGTRLFDGHTVSDTVAAVLKVEPDWKVLPEGLNPALVGLIQRCLAKEPILRMRSISDVKLELEEVSANPLGGHSLPGVAPAPRSRGLLALVIVLAIAGAALAGLWLRERASAPPQRVVQALITPSDGISLTGYNYGAIAFHAISPDGSRIVLISDEQLWVRPLDQANVIPLDGTRGATFPFWSGDSEYVGFFADQKLKTVRASGGPVNVVCDAPDGRGATWSANDVIVFTPALRTGLMQVHSDGGTPTPVTQIERPTHSTHRWPWFLPDAEHLLFTAANHAHPKSPETGIYLTKLGEDEIHRIVNADSNPVYSDGHVVWVRDGNLMTAKLDVAGQKLADRPQRIADGVEVAGGSWAAPFSGSQGNVLTYQGGGRPVGSELVWMDRDGQEISILGERDRHWDVSLSPDGTRLAIAKGAPDPTVWIRDLKAGRETRIVFEDIFVRAPVWSPDGDRLAVAVIREGGHLTIDEVPADGSGQMTSIYEGDADAIPTDWSPDGRHLLVDYGDPGETQIWAIPLEGDRTPFPVVQTPPWVNSGRFSPDGKWIAYTSDETGDVNHIFAVSFPEGEQKQQVSTTSGSSPVWSADQSELFLTPGIHVVDVTTRENALSFGTPQKLFDYSFDGSMFIHSGRYFAVAPDGSQILVARSTPRAQAFIAVTLVIGWTELLEP